MAENKTDTVKPASADPGTHEKHVHMSSDTKGDTAEAEPPARMSSPKRSREQKKGVKHVLLAVDGSGVSNHAVDWYLEELHQPGTIVIFLHSFELPLMHTYEEMYTATDMWQSTLKREADRTKQMQKNMLRKTKIKEIEGKFLAQAGGKPGEAILTAAEKENVDLIVMGTRGHGRFMRAILGSVSHFVMSHANCPVLVYRDKKPRQRSRSRSKSKERACGKNKGNNPGKGKQQDGTETEGQDEKANKKGKKDKNKGKETKED